MAQKPTSGKKTPAKKNGKTQPKVKTKTTAQVKSKTSNTAKIKTKAKSTTKTSTILKKKKKNANLAKLCSDMSKIAIDAVDKEVIKRFKTMIDTYEDDITKVSLTAIMKDPKSVDLNSYNENIQPYIKHYLFMAKRNKK